MKKSRALAQLFALVPGMGHMYLGYMKRGTFYILLEAAVIGLAIFLGRLYLDFLVPFAVLACPIIWIYAFFDCLHTSAKMQREGIDFPEDSFELPVVTDFWKSKKIQTALGVVLICVGSLSIFNTAMNQIDWQIRGRLNFVLPVFASLALIALGFWLLIRPLKKPNGTPEVNQTNEGGEEV
ncbi:MAG: hypothetical protein LBQ48_06355 [Oscillospiraceae bacterium]|jgi:TM2 domain-containing membrane protein YozV|nr:hypothetical protein [Oscillospiraceae bacterium]